VPENRSTPGPTPTRVFNEYVWSCYQANNTVLSPIHLDIISESVGPEDLLLAIQWSRKIRAAANR
jgi:hypothetical protein